MANQYGPQDPYHQPQQPYEQPPQPPAGYPQQQPYGQPYGQPYPPPGYGYGPPPQKPGRGAVFWLLIVCVPILLLFSCVATVVSIGGDTTVTTQEDRPGAVRSAAPESTQPSPVQEAESPAAAENAQPSPVQEAKPSAAAVGGAITLQGRDSGLQVAVTLVKVVENAKPKNDYSKPETGNRFFAVQLILNNTGQAAYSDSPTNGAYVIDAEGQQYSSAYGDVQEGVSFHGSVTMGAGDSRKGIIVFEVPQAAKISKFQFALNSGFADQKGEWLTQAAG